MSLWNPPEQVSEKEMVGRRSFTKKLKLENGHYRVDVFLDDRVGTGLSIDRLGVRNADSEIIEYLEPLARNMAAIRGRPFVGWAQVKVGDLSRLKIESTEADGEINPFHAEVNRDDCHNEGTLYMLSFMLAVKASEYDFIQSPES